MRLRGTVPPPCRRSAFYVAVEAENGSYTWLRLRASRGLPRLSAAFRAAHSMHIPRPFRAFRESRHVPQLPCLTLHDATHGINGWLLCLSAQYNIQKCVRILTYVYVWSLFVVYTIMNIAMRYYCMYVSHITLHLPPEVYTPLNSS